MLDYKITGGSFEWASHWEDSIKRVVLNSDYSKLERLVLVQDCEDDFNLYIAKNYSTHTCQCGVESLVRYVGTKHDILMQLKSDTLNDRFLQGL